jgi:hypothetical protein
VFWGNDWNGVDHFRVYVGVSHFVINLYFFFVNWCKYWGTLSLYLWTAAFVSPFMSSYHDLVLFAPFS